VNRYSRQDVLRILRISYRQLSAWERAGLIAIAADYGFQDLVQLRKLRDLRAQRISASNISASVEAMKAVSGIPNPLLETGITRRGPRLVFRHLGASMDPIAGQFEFDFEGGGSRLAIVDDGATTAAQRQNKIGTLFFEGVRCEEQGKVAEAAALYEKTLSLGEHAPAAINLGTILYNQRQFERAEQLYRRATIANPDYALAFFDLGNALDVCRPAMPMRITTWRLPASAATSGAAPCGTGLRTSSSIPSAPGPTMRACRCAKFWTAKS